MKISEVICDRCGKKQSLVTKNDIIISFARIALHGVGQGRTTPAQRIDLCEQCYEQFIAFMERGAN